MAADETRTFRGRPTCKDVAAIAGVSITTASLTLNGHAEKVGIATATVERIRSAAAQLGYQPSLLPKILQSGKSGVVPVLSSAITWAHEPWIYTGVRDALAARGLTAPAYENWGEDEADAQILRDLLGRQVDGLIVTNTRLFSAPECANVFNAYRLNGVPVVGSLLPAEVGAKLGIPTNDWDRPGAYYRATQYLISLGHTRIGLIVTLSELRRSTKLRLEGYQQALVDSGLLFDPDLCQRVAPEIVQRDTYLFDQGYLSAKRMWETARPSAILATNDNEALGALRFAYEAGLSVPGDLSVVGWGDFPQARNGLCPLTTMHAPLYEAGRWMAEIVATAIEEERLPDPVHEVVEVPLVIRATTGPPRI